MYAKTPLFGQILPQPGENRLGSYDNKSYVTNPSPLFANVGIYMYVQTALKVRRKGLQQVQEVKNRYQSDRINFLKIKAAHGFSHCISNVLSFGKYLKSLSMEPQQETRNAHPLTFDDIGIPTGPRLNEGALGKVGKDWCQLMSRMAKHIDLKYNYLF